MKKTFAAVLALSLALTACAPAAPTNTAPPVNANASNSNAAATPTASPTATPVALGSSEAELPVTLPMLDAMFADESFAGELKSKVQLTDEQVAALREAAREGTASLSEQEAGSGKTSDATRAAAEKIKSAIGEEKAAQFATFVRERGGTGLLPSKPNSVPADTRVVVNAPAYRMDVFQNGTLVKTYKVGIGYPEFPLPQGMRKAETIIFNPTWTPPDEPWVKGKVKPGEKIEAGSKLNPLGPIKIPIGQPSLIHGGKNPARLGTFASHGCVGLTNAMVQDFAVVLAQAAGAQLTAANVSAYAQKRDKTQSYKLPTPVPVELRYETIVVEEGRLHIYRDVYDKGTNTEENLRRVLEVYGVKLEDLSEQERAQVKDALQAMARDAHGNPTEASPTPTPAKAKKKPQSGNVTYGVKGDKEVVIEVAALAGRGYPAPVNLMPPAPQQKQQPATKTDAAAPKKKKNG